MALWEQILVGVLVLLLLLWFRPGIRAALRQSRDAKSRDWSGVIFPVGLVVLFVLLLIALVRG
jgi:hypothetical protein